MNQSILPTDVQQLDQLTQSYLGQGSVINNLAASASASLQECQKKTDQIKSQQDQLQNNANSQTLKYKQATEYNNQYLQGLQTQFEDMKQQYATKMTLIQNTQIELSNLKEQVINQNAQVQQVLEQKAKLIGELNQQIKEKQCNTHKNVCYALLIVFAIVIVSSMIYTYQQKGQTTYTNIVRSFRNTNTME